jgi:SAM-dependent methyltransferase
MDVGLAYVSVPLDFKPLIQKWRDATLKERSAAQEHFIDLCRLLGEPTPAEADPGGAWYCFEKGARKTGGGDGWADVWKKGCFGWEYKSKGKDMGAALKQLQLYALALESPPLLIVSDIETIYLHTAFTNAVPEIHVITLDGLADPEQRRLLKWAFSEPERLRPGLTIPELTEQAAGRFADIARNLHRRGHDPQRVAHFLNKLLFCLFAEDSGLLPRQLFTRLLENGVKAPSQMEALLRGLFKAMSGGGPFGVEVIDWFNGGLFDGDDTLPLDQPEVQALLDVSRLDWSAIEPALFGTLFERGLDPAKRAQLGAHYTDRQSILRLTDPVIREPLLAEWEAAKAVIGKDQTKTRKKALQAYAGFLERLHNFRVLDPACGSGNFLYLALQTLKDLEHQAILEAGALGLPPQFPSVGPEAVHGIEINPYAAELARVTVWIGEIQWMLKHGLNLGRNPILRPLDTIEQRDAVLNEDGTEAQWPTADVIIGNPPFLGGSKLLGGLGEEYTQALRTCYQGRVPGGADFVCYWFEKARAHIETGKTQRAGLVATNSIRGGANRKVLERINETGRIFHAWGDEPWINEGAAVRVSLVGFSGKPEVLPVVLDGKPAHDIYSDLTTNTENAGSIDVTGV